MFCSYLFLVAVIDLFSIFGIFLNQRHVISSTSPSVKRQMTHCLSQLAPFGSIRSSAVVRGQLDRRAVAARSIDPLTETAVPQVYGTN